MKYRIRTFTAMILTLALALTLFSGCSGKNAAGATPEDTVAALEEALNTADTEGVLACLSSDLSSRVQALLTLAGIEEEPSAGRLLTLLRLLVPMLPGLSGGAIEADDLPQVRLTPEEVLQEEHHAEVTVAGQLLCGDLTIPFSITLTMEPEEDIWVITGIA